MLHLLLDVIAGPMILFAFWPIWVIALIVIAVAVTVAIIHRRRKKK